MVERRTETRRVFACVRVHDLAASVEAREQGGRRPAPAQHSIAPVVIYDEAGQRVVSASPGARKRGVRPGMTRWEAEQRCPDLLAAQADPEKYEYFWQRVVEVCGDYSPEVSTDHADYTGCTDGNGLGQEASSCPTCMLDLTGSERLFGPPKEVAREIRNRLRAEVGVTASVGIGPNPTIARLACELAKSGEVMEVAPEEAAEFVGRAPVAMLPGVDLELAGRLGEMGIRKAKDLAALPEEAVARAFGEEGRRAWEAARGEDERLGQETRRRPGSGGQASSCPTTNLRHQMDFIAAEIDLRPAAEERARIRAGLRAAADEVARKLREHGEVAQQVGVEMVFRELRKVGTRRTLRHPTRSAEVIFQTARGLLSHVKLGGRLVRRVRVRVALLSPGPHGGQMSLPLLEPEARRERLAEMVDRVKDRFGEGAVVRGSVRELVRL